MEGFKEAMLPSGPKSAGQVSVGDAVKEMVGTVGENCQLRNAKSIEVKEGVLAQYMHTPMGEKVGKLGVIVALESTADKQALTGLGESIAMHIAAAKPLYLEAKDIPVADEEHEKRIFSEQAAESGKPQNVIEKMVDGRVRKWHEEVVLLEQEYLLGQGKKQKVLDVLKEAELSLKAPVTISGFIRLKCGEGQPPKEPEH
mmetsp:Transcript_6148/g.9783  ORF Transcript_6148/g.9783 Transcript_6148/m.9783 type:complete len:200 (+) Transcript_6148:153-752(+)|eukprot:CAMPEP_0184299984 /NCGR_PEP_ID=MMETSP1049-20130417/10494_1 /TAXON_ID=77928 /ORGANISM="Proteomonas sulcata, Strain CCMP704" /LENGTH=199 /DNA_ID=CAMNT_0026610585 /DNA_START=133 /DNA_END=732 /DNA_ORIENTATION=+